MTLRTVLELAPALVGFLWRESLFAAVVFLVVAPLCWLLRRSPATSYLLWSLVFVRLVLPVDWSHPWSASSLLGRIVSASSPAAGSAVASVVLAAPGGPAAAMPAESASFGPLALFGLWLAGVAAVLTGFARRRSGYRRHLREARLCREAGLLELMDGMRRSYRLRREVRLLISDARVMPFTAGIVRPVVLLPASVARDRSLARVALAHELAHVARRDSVFLALQNAIQAVYFFHPLAWLAGFFLHRQREQLCDAMALSRFDLDPKGFARGLLAILRLHLRPVAPVALITTPKRSLGMRIHNILESAKRRETKVLSFSSVLLLALFLLPLSAWSETGGGTAAEPGWSSQSSPVVRFILMTGIVGAEGIEALPKITAKDFDDDSLALTTESTIESIESVTKGSLGLGQDGVFFITTGPEEKPTRFWGAVAPLSVAEQPAQYLVQLEIHRDDEVVSAPTLVLLAGAPGIVTTTVDGKQVALYLLIGDSRD